MYMRMHIQVHVPVAGTPLFGSSFPEAPARQVLNCSNIKYLKLYSYTHIISSVFTGASTYVYMYISMCVYIYIFNIVIVSIANIYVPDTVQK